MRGLPFRVRMFQCPSRCALNLRRWSPGEALTRELILQGLTKRTHIDVLREMLSLADIERVILSVAFVTEGGVEQIEQQLKPHSGKATVFAGIRNDITSAQAIR